MSGMTSDQAMRLLLGLRRLEQELGLCLHIDPPFHLVIGRGHSAPEQITVTFYAHYVDGHD